jgi:ribokinase
VKAARLARALGIPVVTDIERPPAPGVDELLVLTDHLIIGRDLARQLTGEGEPQQAVQALAKTPRQVTVVTAGALGCWYCLQDGAVTYVPALKVKVVDTTGCGDVFHGAYAANIALGESIPRAIQVATVTAGIKTSYPGGRSGIPRREDVDRVLAE